MEQDLKKSLKAGDVIRFHDWGNGSILIGIIVKEKLEDDYYDNEYNIWRSRDMYYLMSHGIDCIKIIKNLDDLDESEEYLKGEVFSVLCAAKSHGIKYNFEWSE